MAINDVSLTAGMRANLLALQDTVNLLNRTQSRLSTGKKVNTAIDNPVSFFASQALTSRASVIDSLKDAMGQAVQTITAADKGIKAITAMIEQAKGIAQSALSAAEGATETENAATISTYQTVSLTIGTLADMDQIVIGGQTFVFTDRGDAGDFTDAASLATQIGNLLDGSGYNATNNAGTITIERANTSLTVADIDVSGAAVGQTTVAVADAEERSFTVDGTTFTYTAGTDYAIGAGASAAVAGLLAADVEAAGIGAATVVGSTVTIALPSTELESLETQYNTLLNQLTELADDSGYKGKNLLANNDLVVKFEGTTLTVEGFDASAAGLGITEATWTIGGSIDADVTRLDNALVTLRQESSKMSGNLSIITVRQEFSTNMINTLTEGADKLTLADTNEEGANMLMLQTRQSLSTTALSLSAQAAQSVLRLFQ